MSFEIHDANLSDAAHAAGLLAVLDDYAAGPMGGRAPLAADVRERLVPALRENPAAVLLLAITSGPPLLDVPSPDAPPRIVGVATCFVGFSTFHARSLLNVHDLAVLPAFQGRGIGHALLSAAEERARARGCCKLTLEVREDNARARGLYARQGFRDFELAGQSFTTLFLSKSLGA